MGELAVLDEQALGDLELEQAGREPGRPEGGCDRAYEVGLLELAGGDIDADDDAGAAEALPAAGVVAGLLEDPTADLGDLAGFLGEGDEDVGADEAALRVVPAHERLHADGGRRCGG